MSSGHAVVDGSNIATEGRSEPSLAQLEEALAAFRDEYDFAHITVIVDASFEHRVSKAERARARAEIESGDIITPPAGVVGRGDTFILQVAHRANAVVLSNDSFQEFHGTYPWLFEEGRLIGGKPVPAVGWIYVPRVPVRGPVSRRATKASSSTPKATAKTARAEKAAPMKAAKAPARKARATKAPPKKADTAKPAAKKAPAKKATRKGASETPGTNADRKWKAFRKAHPEGSSITATIERFSSHGAYADSDGVEVYLPLRLLSDPPPRRARDLIAIGESRTFFVHRFDNARRGIDIGIVPFDGTADSSESPTAPAKGRGAAKKTTAKRSARKTTAKKAPARKATAKKAPANRAPAKKATRTPTVRKATAKRGPARKVAPNPPALKKAAAKPASPRKAAGARSGAAKTPAKKAATRKAGRRRR